MRKVLLVTLLLAACAGDEVVPLGNGEHIITATQRTASDSIATVQRRAVAGAAQTCAGRDVEPIGTQAVPPRGFDAATFTLRFRCK